MPVYQPQRFERETQRTLAAIAGSLLVNLAALYLIGWFLLWQSIARAAIRTEAPNEVVVTLEELVPEVIQPQEEAEKQPTPYIDTYANQESDVAPDDPKFESDRNTLAVTESAPTEPSEMEVPTQEGKEAPIPVVQLQDHQFADGPDGGNPEFRRRARGNAGAAGGGTENSPRRGQKARKNRGNHANSVRSRGF